MEPYRSYFPDAGLALPVTERLCRQVLSLPTGTSVSEENIKIICQLITFVIENSDEVRARMGRCKTKAAPLPDIEEENVFCP